MIGMINNSQQMEMEKKEELRLRDRVIPLLTLLLVIAISVGLFFYGRNPERIAQLKGYGYLGVFLVSLIGNATVLLLPAAVLPILVAIGVVLYPVTGSLGPVLIGVVGGAGAAIGEISGYMVGYSGRGVVRNKKIYLRLVGWMRRWGALAIFVFSLMPLVFDLAGMAAGVLRFPLWKFIIVCWLGRTLLYVVVIVLATMGWFALIIMGLGAIVLGMFFIRVMRRV